MSATVIVGTGIIGVSTAYYLAEHQPPSSIHLVEPSPELFSSASGYAGGFLAKDWFRPPLASLGSLSYDLHRRLAEANNGREKWGYATTTSIRHAWTVSDTSYSGKDGHDWMIDGSSRSNAAPSVQSDVGEKLPAWLRQRQGDEYGSITDDGSTAQL